MFILKKAHQPGVYVPLMALFLVVLVIGKAQFRRAMLSCDSSCCKMLASGAPRPPNIYMSPCYIYGCHFIFSLFIPPQTVFVGGYQFAGGILFSRCPTVRVSVTFCFHNNFKNH